MYLDFYRPVGTEQNRNQRRRRVKQWPREVLACRNLLNLLICSNHHLSNASLIQKMSFSLSSLHIKHNSRLFCDGDSAALLFPSTPVLLPLCSADHPMCFLHRSLCSCSLNAPIHAGSSAFLSCRTQAMICFVHESFPDPFLPNPVSCLPPSTLV